jgi:hypothetical protein
MFAGRRIKRLRGQDFLHAIVPASDYKQSLAGIVTRRKFKANAVPDYFRGSNSARCDPLGLDYQRNLTTLLDHKVELRRSAWLPGAGKDRMIVLSMDNAQMLRGKNLRDGQGQVSLAEQALSPTVTLELQPGCEPFGENVSDGRSVLRH